MFFVVAIYVHSNFYFIEIGSADTTVYRWETSKSWDMAVLYPKTRRHLLEHMWKLVGGVVPNTPSGGRELEHFTSVEGNRPNFILNDCTISIHGDTTRREVGNILWSLCNFLLFLAHPLASASIIYESGLSRLS